MRWALLTPAQGRQVAEEAWAPAMSPPAHSVQHPPKTLLLQTPSNWYWGQHITDAQGMWLNVFTDYKARSHPSSSPKTLMSTMQCMKTISLILHMRSLRLWQLSGLSQVMWLKKRQSQHSNPGFHSSALHTRGPPRWRRGVRMLLHSPGETSQGSICASVPAQWVSIWLTVSSPKPASTPLPPPPSRPFLGPSCPQCPSSYTQPLSLKVPLESGLSPDCLLDSGLLP